MDTDGHHERAAERLVAALAAQVATTAVLADPGLWDELTRDETRDLFGIAGQLAHYEGDPGGRLAALTSLILERMRVTADPAAPLRPGDRVRHVGKDRCYTVLYLGLDETVDVQPSWLDDYVVETVPIHLIAPLD